MVVRGWCWVGFRCWEMVGLRGDGPACFVWSGSCRVWNTLSWNAGESTDNWGPYYYCCYRCYAYCFVIGPFRSGFSE